MEKGKCNSKKILCVIVMYLFLCTYGYAYDFEVDNIYYSINEDAHTTVSVTRGPNRYTGDIVIPSTVKNKGYTYNVTIIDENAFLGEKIVSITMPNSIVAIKKFAFSQCNQLTSVIIPNGVKTIGANAFQQCNSLISISIPYSVTSIGDYAFWGSLKINSVVCDITPPFNIYSTAFSNSIYSTATLTVPFSMKPLYQQTEGWKLFSNIVEKNGSGSERIIHVATAGTLSELIIEADKYSIEGLTLTGELNSSDFRLLRDMAGNDAWGNQTKGMLSNLDFKGARIVAGGEKYLDTDTIMCEGERSIGHYRYAIEQNDELPKCIFYGCKLKTVSISNGAISIGDGGFKHCNYLSSIQIPNSMISLGDSAFYGCNSLITLNIPENLTSIGNSVFQNCHSLSSINVNNTNKKYMSSLGVLYDKILLKLICYPSGKESESYIIPYNMKIIGEKSFSDCSNLTSLTIPNSIITIESSAFEGCGNMMNIISELQEPFSIEDDVFPLEVYSQATLYIPQRMKMVYQQTSGWKNFINIVEKEKKINTLTLHVSPAGTLHDYISEADKYNIEKLTITGELNSTDFRLLRDMAGCDYLCNETNGQLKVLDFSDSRIVAGGEMYMNTNNDHLSIMNNDELSKKIFYGCKFISVIISNSTTTIGDQALANCKNLNSFIIPNSVTAIGNSSFAGCSSLTSLSIPNSVTTINSSIIGGCSNLVSFAIPNVVKTIGRSDFWGCTRLSCIRIPNSITYIDKHAFEECSNLICIISEMQAPSSLDETIFSNETYTKAKLIVPQGTKSVYRNIWPWSNFIQIIETNESVNPIRTIHVSTAGTLPNLISQSEKNNIIALTLTGEINGTDFRLLRDMAGCNFLGEETSGTLKYLDMSGVMIRKGGNKYLDTDQLLTSNGSFHYSVNNFDVLPPHVFHGCKFVSINIPTSVFFIGNNAFEECKELATITIPNNVIEIDSFSFYNCCSMTLVTIGSGVTRIGKGAFANCNHLSAFNIYDNCSFKSDIGVLYNKDGTEIICYPIGKKEMSLTIPSSVTHIGSYSFYECTSLSSIIFPEHLQSIGDAAFYHCSGLSSVVIPNSVSYIGDQAFQKCHNLLSVSLPDSIETINDKTFQDCTILPSIIIPSSVKYIGNSAFQDCRNLLSINFPDNVTSIGNYAFYQCVKLSFLSLSNSLCSIGEAAFGWCNSLIAITIPCNVSSIGDKAFFGCLRLVSVKSEIVEPFFILENTFGPYDGVTLTVPIGTGSAYQSTDNWNRFNNIVEAGPTREIHVATAGTLQYRITDGDKYNIEELVLTGELNSSDFRLLGDMAGRNYLNQSTEGKLKALDFSNVNIVSGGDFYLKTINFYYSSGVAAFNKSVELSVNEYNVLPQCVFTDCNFEIVKISNHVTSIGMSAFSHCQNLTSVAIPNSVTSIDESAFSQCNLLASIIIPNGVKKIEKYAFQCCDSLAFVLSEIVVPFDIDKQTFSFSTYNTATLIVPQGTKAIYYKKEGWKNFKNIVEIDNSYAESIYIANVQDNNGFIYNLKGQRTIKKGNEPLSLLPKGIYIMNGKKIIVK